MNMARYDTPLALVYDRYVLAFGGKTSKYHGTKRCELFDTKTEQWLQMAPIPFFCVNTAACVIQKRHVYLMPGRNRENLVNQSMIIGYLDTGAIEKNTDGLPSIQWSKLWVHGNAEFNAAGPVTAITLKSDPFKMLLFGGSTTKTFTIDTRKDINLTQGTIKVSPHAARLAMTAQFANKVDLTRATFNGVHYTIDACMKVLHVYNEKEQKWEGQSLQALGIDAGPTLVVSSSITTS